jgi:hypothetical protein
LTSRPSGPQRAEGALPHRRADAVRDRVDGRDLLGPVGVGEERAAGCAERPRPLELLRRARGDEDARSESRRDLDQKGGDAAAGARHQDRLPRACLGVRDDDPPRRQPRERQRRGLEPRQVRRPRSHLVRGDDDPLRVRPLVGDAEDAEARAGRSLVVAPVERRVDHHLGADGDALDAGADRGDDPGAVAAEHGRQRDFAADPDPQVTPVQRCRDEVDADLSGPGLRVGQLDRTKPVRAAELLQLDRSHGIRGGGASCSPAHEGRR